MAYRQGLCSALARKLSKHKRVYPKSGYNPMCYSDSGQTFLDTNDIHLQTCQRSLPHPLQCGSVTISGLVTVSVSSVILERLTLAGGVSANASANLTITEGDLFDEKTMVKHVFVDGRPVDISEARGQRSEARTGG